MAFKKALNNSANEIKNTEIAIIFGTIEGMVNDVIDIHSRKTKML
jgi:hypothetical protein